MKKIFMFITVLSLAFLLIACSNETSNKETDDLSLEGDVLVLYYTYTNTTEVLAKEIAQITNGELVLIELLEPYPESVDDLEVFTGTNAIEYGEMEYPEITTKIDNLEEYEYIFLGTPVWFSDAALPMKAFIEEHTFSDNQVILPFVTSDSGQGRGVQESIEEILNNAQIADVFDDREYTTEMIEEWIKNELEL